MSNKCDREYAMTQSMKSGNVTEVLPWPVRSLIEFARDESGLVTVEWMTISTMCAGLGISIMLKFGGAVSGLAEDIRTAYAHSSVIVVTSAEGNEDNAYTSGSDSLGIGGSINVNGVEANVSF